MYRVEVVNVDAAYVLSVFFSLYDETNLSCGEQVAVVEQEFFNLIKRIRHVSLADSPYFLVVFLVGTVSGIFYRFFADPALPPPLETPPY